MSKKENLSQKYQLEVLLQEVETIKAKDEIINKSFPILEQKLNEVRNLQMTADINQGQINEINATLKRFSEHLNLRLGTRVLLPKWLVISLISLVLLFATSVYFNYRLNNKLKLWKQTAQIWNDRAIESGYKK